MAKYVTTDSNHLPTGFYDSAIPGTTIPGGAHAITNAQYDALISAPATAWRRAAYSCRASRR